jgi:hypothetical protein
MSFAEQKQKHQNKSQSAQTRANVPPVQHRPAQLPAQKAVQRLVSSVPNFWLLRSEYLKITAKTSMKNNI